MWISDYKNAQLLTKFNKTITLHNQHGMSPCCVIEAGRSEPIQKRRITMITRIGTLFKTALRNRMESDELFRVSNLGLRGALRFLQEATIFSFTGINSDYYPSGSGLWRYFDSRSEEGSWLQGWFNNNETTRVQAVISLVEDDSIDLELKFFQKGRGSDIQHMTFNFTKEGKCLNIHT